LVAILVCCALMHGRASFRWLYPGSGQISECCQLVYQFRSC
jgi:hypothetical protein